MKSFWDFWEQVSDRVLKKRQTRLIQLLLLDKLLLHGDHEQHKFSSWLYSFIHNTYLLPVVLVLLVFAGESPGVEGVVGVPGAQHAGLGHGAGVCVPRLPRHGHQLQGGQI